MVGKANSGSKAKGEKTSTVKHTPKSPSLDMNDDTGSIESSKKQLRFKTPAAKQGAEAEDQKKASAKKRPLAIQEEEEPAAKKGKSPGKMTVKVSSAKKDAPTWKELEKSAAAERAQSAKSSSLKLANPKARSPKELLIEEARSEKKKTPSPRMTRGQRSAVGKATPPARQLPTSARN